MAENRPSTIRTRQSKRRLIINYVHSYNLFQSYPPSTDFYHIQNELISTRTYLLLLILSIVILIIYKFQENLIHTNTIVKPTIEQYDELFHRYSNALTCPCENIAVSHETFIALYPDFHQVCSSDFISPEWFIHINAAADRYINKDFSYTGGPLFQALATFCNSAKASLTNSLILFNSTRFITATVVHEKHFLQQIQSIINAFKITAIEKFILSFNMIREMTHANSLTSGLLTNAKLSINSLLYLAEISFEYYNNNTCNCFTSPSCLVPLTRQASNSSQLFTIPGLYIGCYLVEAMRKSSLECFYNQSCLNELESILHSPISFKPTILDPTRSKYPTNTTVDTLLSQAMIEYWYENISWSNYYNQCKPTICIYTRITKHNVWHILVMILSLIGGIVKVLRFMIPVTVKYLRKYLCGIRPAESLDEQPNISRLKRFLNLNMFRSIPPSIDEHVIRKQIISTRLFIYILLIFIALILTYLSTDTVITTYTINSPSYDEYLTLYEQRHHHSLSCPCSSLITKYQDILKLDIDLHPICSSDFIHPPWTDFFMPYSILDGSEFRTYGPPVFQTLASYCRLATNHIQMNLQTLNTTQLITAELLNELEFRTHINITMHTFLLTMINSFLRSINLITKITRANGIVSTQGTNFYPYVGGTTSITPNSNSSLFNFYYRSINSNCYCFPSVTCTMLISTSDSSLEYIFKSMKFYLGCLPDEGVRQSSLQALFDPILVNYMNTWYYFPSNTVKVLDVNRLRMFKIESSVDYILSHMMINQRNWLSYHKIYYEQCRPAICTYTQVDRKSFLVIFTTFIGLIGGITAILEVIVPLLVQVMFTVYARLTRQRGEERIRFSFKSLIIRLIDKLRQINLFRSISSAHDPNQLKTELISTRIFILLLIMSTIIVIIHSALTILTKVVTIKSPSIDIYRSLYLNYSDTLSCPCTNIAIEHNQFLILRPKFHQICSSKLITSRWIVGITSNRIHKDFTNIWYDFRLLGGSFFLTISLLCELANKTITNGLIHFERSSMITNRIISEYELNIQGLDLMNLFIITIKNDFMNSLRIIRETTQANVLISGYGTNIQMSLDNTVKSIANYTKYFNCSCADSSQCSQEAGIYDRNGILLYPIPGIRIGCYVLEATLQSSLFTFYNQTWLENYRNWTRFIDPYFPVNALNSSSDRNFNINTTIESMIEQLMVDEWINKNISFTNYYSQCQPQECKYTYMKKNDLIYIFTTVISIIGGLRVVLPFIIPPVVTIIRRIYLKRRMRRVQTNTNI